jgi:alpha-mannosidase
MMIEPTVFRKLADIQKTYELLRFVDVLPVAMEIAQTPEHFRKAPVDEKTLHWEPVRPGESWGDDWWSAWFRTTVTLPESSTSPAFLRVNTGAPESLLIVNGRHQGVFTENHPVRLLDLNPKAGQEYAIYVEAYAGHSFPGTMPFDRPVAVRGGETQDCGKLITKNCRVFLGAAIVGERADVTEFVLDLRALLQLAQQLEETSLRRARIQAALQQVFAIVSASPFETSELLWRTQLQRATDVMRPLLTLKNGPTCPSFGIVGHSHIDTAWLWMIEETKRKLARTFSSVLSLMEQYPEFRFTSSAAYHMDAVRALYPELFVRIQQRVKEGRWEINGAMWIEPDCNLPNGESLVRQCMVGQAATREMFGITSDTLWQPDVFGYSGALPQILRKCEVEHFCTTKLQYNDTNKFPYDSFVWKGIDGSSVMAHFNSIGGNMDPLQLMYAWKDIKHMDVQDRFLVAFGHGDGGGGPTAEMIQMARKVEDLEGCPKTHYQSISEFMTDMRRELCNLPTWSGELYLELHRGTLTSMGEIKRLNRRCEFSLRSAEFFLTLAHLLTPASYPACKLLATWKVLLLNQFHDILPGSSIAEVNDQAVAELSECLLDSLSLRDDALKKLSGGSLASTSLLLGNDLSWTRSGELALTGVNRKLQPAGCRGVQEIEDLDGQTVLLVDGLSVPPMGFCSTSTEIRKTDTTSAFKRDSGSVETPFARIRFDTSSNITDFFDKASQIQLVTQGGAFNIMMMGEDIPDGSDNWDINRDQRLKLVAIDTAVNCEVIADGPLQLRIRRHFRLGFHSTVTQDIVFHATSPRVNFDTLVDWHEKHQLLKAGFSLDVLSDSARHEIQYGYLSRSSHDNTSLDQAKFDVCAHKWTDISEVDFGVTFLNDCKYACTVKDGTYQLSLLKSGRHPDDRGDEGRHRFCYSVLPHYGGFSVKSVTRPAYELNAPVVAVGGSAARISFSLVAIDAESVIVEVVKWAEDGNGFFVRLYEAGRTGTHVGVRFGVAVASVFETNMLEEKPQAVAVKENAVALYFRPFEIKTLRCVPA